MESVTKERASRESVATVERINCFPQIEISSLYATKESIIQGGIFRNLHLQVFCNNELL